MVLLAGAHVVDQCAVCSAVDEAPHLPTAGTSSASAFEEKAQADFLCLDGNVTAHAMDLLSKLHPLALVSSKNPSEVRLPSGPLDCGKPRGAKMDAGRE